MPEHRQHRALLALEDGAASSVLAGYFHARGDLVEATPVGEVLTSARVSRPCVILLELHAGELHARTHLIQTLRRELAQAPIVAIVPPVAEIGFEAARSGALTLLTLPLDEAALASRLDPLVHSLSCGSSFAAESDPSSLADLPSLFDAGSSAQMKAIRGTIGKVAGTSATVLIRGESGVGKEIAARMIYQTSERREKAFVKVNCAAIPHELLESELFGFEAGAFTGAIRAKPGKFELANGGTLFLDEIAEMHPSLQAKLLHVLQDGRFARLGSKRDSLVDVRVICATNRRLEERVAEGLFREDLLYRINVVTLDIPPLRERRSEIANLTRYFVEKYSNVYGRAASPLSADALAAMTRYSWPGNIRELENFCKRYVIVGEATSMVRDLESRAGGPRLTASGAVPPEVTDAVPVLSFPGPRESEPSLLEIGRRAAWDAERKAIEEILAATRWNRREAARRLHISYKALLNKIKQLERETAARSG